MGIAEQPSAIPILSAIPSRGRPGQDQCPVRSSDFSRSPQDLVRSGGFSRFLGATAAYGLLSAASTAACST
jgi:hypothetical protein